jgi:hypothetical protein
VIKNFDKRLLGELIPRRSGWRQVLAAPNCEFRAGQLVVFRVELDGSATHSQAGWYRLLLEDNDPMILTPRIPSFVLMPAEQLSDLCSVKTFNLRLEGINIGPQFLHLCDDPSSAI